MNSPITPGHESIGDVVAVGTGEAYWKVGDRVGAAWQYVKILLLLAAFHVEALALVALEVNARLKYKYQVPIFFFRTQVIALT